MPRNNVTNEFAVIGLGRFGSSLARTLISRGAIVLGIDRSPELVQELADELTQAAVLDSTNEAALREVDITSFKTVIVAIGSNFEANLLTTVALRELGIPNIICKALNIRQRDILLKVGANRVVLPEYEAGHRLALELTIPGMLGQMDLGPGYAISEIKAPARITNTPLNRSDLRKLNLHVLAVKRGDHLIVSPAQDFVPQPDDVLVVIGKSADIERCTEGE
ncbi:MAG: TrkA family potassium uptake protein [Anaerolineae bacterium]|jgi:trk system potassium uptake protein TrkA|nr:TrkA family potassium uptake protein [Anaerolineae bacterium]